MTGRKSAVAAIVAAVVSGCGSGQKGRDAPPTAARTTPASAAIGAPRPLRSCRSTGQRWSPLPTSGYAAPDAAYAGNGRIGVVFVNDSTNDACAWSALARELTGRGYVVAVFDGPSASYQVDQALSVAAALRRRTRVRRAAMIGASVGARAALQIGAEHPRAAVALVALSAERRINHGGDLLPLSRRVRVPVLSVGSRQDPLTSFGRDTRAWDRTIPRVRTLLLPGAGHGVEFLHGRHGRRVRAAIVRFLGSTSPSHFTD
jgi:pimeloyl-ACP methyl ester carboxylesterase